MIRVRETTCLPDHGSKWPVETARGEAGPREQNCDNEQARKLLEARRGLANRTVTTSRDVHADWSGIVVVVGRGTMVVVVGSDNANDCSRQSANSVAETLEVTGRLEPNWRTAVHLRHWRRKLV